MLQWSSAAAPPILQRPTATRLLLQLDAVAADRGDLSLAVSDRGSGDAIARLERELASLRATTERCRRAKRLSRTSLEGGVANAHGSKHYAGVGGRATRALFEAVHEVDSALESLLARPSPSSAAPRSPAFSPVSSPEILVRVRDGEVTIRPIAGTRPRGKTGAEDVANRDSLLADPKERAEHLMLLDLGRNDVGRAAQAGSVRVTDSYTVEFYSHVMHIVSNVVGRLADDKDALDALFAGFPAGTVSGAPKVRACQIIAELEPERRGAYAGGVGYFSPDGSMDSCIVLRTAVVKDGTIHVQAGAGIVADSDPAYEQRECEAKAGAMLAAAKDAVARADEGNFGQ